MSSKLAYIYACSVFIKTGFLVGKKRKEKEKKKEKKKNRNWPPLFSPAMEISAGHRAPRPTPEDQTSCSKNSINYTFKSDDKCSSP